LYRSLSRGGTVNITPKLRLYQAKREFALGRVERVLPRTPS